MKSKKGGLIHAQDILSDATSLIEAAYMAAGMLDEPGCSAVQTVLDVAQRRVKKADRAIQKVRNIDRTILT